MTFLLGVVAFVVSLRARARLAARYANVRVSPWIVAGLVGLLCAVTFLQLRELDAAAAAAVMPPWQRALPLHVFTRAFVEAKRGAGLETSLQIAAFVQTALLFGLAFAVPRAGSPRAVAGIVAAGAAVLASEAWCARVAGADVYAYVAFGLSPHPYRPGAAFLPLADRAIAHLWGRPLVPCPYGPLWLALAHAIASPGRSLAANVIAFRAVGLAATAASIAALLALRKPVTAALFALDPTLWQLYVAEAHNDVVGVALVLGALAIRRRSLGAAILFVALAGVVKLPFLLIGAVVFASGPTWRARLFPAAAAAFGGVALSLAFGGGDYIAALARTARTYAYPIGALEWNLHLTVAAIACGAVVAAVVAARFFWGAPWSFVALGQYPIWQYLGWGIPYAVLDETQGLLYLALLPVSGFELSLLFPDPALLAAGRVALLAALLVAFALAFRRPRAAPRRVAA